MSKKNWFTSVKVVSRKSLMNSLNKKRDKDAPLPRVRGARIIDMGAWRYPRVGSRIFYIDRFEIFYTTRDIIKIFDIDKSTVYKWQRAGLLPPPLFKKVNKYGKATSYYARPQLVVAARVVNDLRRQGVLRFTRAKVAQHVEMVAEGNEYALERWHDRRARNSEKRKRGKSSVRWVREPGK